MMMMIMIIQWTGRLGRCFDDDDDDDDNTMDW
jgi:hypothetical protein